MADKGSGGIIKEVMEREDSTAVNSAVGVFTLNSFDSGS